MHITYANLSVGVMAVGDLKISNNFLIFKVDNKNKRERNFINTLHQLLLSPKGEFFILIDFGMVQSCL